MSRILVIRRDRLPYQESALREGDAEAARLSGADLRQMVDRLNVPTLSELARAVAGGGGLAVQVAVGVPPSMRDALVCRACAWWGEGENCPSCGEATSTFPDEADIPDEGLFLDDTPDLEGK